MPFLCVRVCARMGMCKNVPIFMQIRAHFMGLHLCAGGMGEKKMKENFSCTVVDSNCPPLSCLLGRSYSLC